jgi:stringent starvation protein B
MDQSLENPNEQKRCIVEALLPLCPFLLLDATVDGVDVPESLRRGELVLRVGRDPKVMGMPDLTLDIKGFSATISMRGMRYFVTVPWEACTRCWIGDPYAGPMVIWPDTQPPKPENSKPPPALRLVKD